MVELGQTTDPKALVPGEPDAVEDTVAKFRSQSKKFHAIGEDLKRVDIVGWSGAASDAFLERFSKEPLKWLKSSDALDAAAKALAEQAGTLRWAQAQAAEAIALWQEAQEATEKARAQHNAAVARASAKNQAAATGSHSHVASVAPFSDPGERLREEARQMLARARAQLEETGSRIARTIGGAGSRGQDLLGELADVVLDGWKSTGKAEASGPGAGFETKGPGNGSLGELKAYAQLGKASAEGAVGNDFLKLSGKAEAAAEATVTLAASVTDEGLKARAEASIGGKASAEGRADLGPVGLNAKGEAFAGAQAGAQVTAGPKGLSATADAFAGAKGTVKGGGDIGGIGVNVVGEGWAGAGAEAGVTFGEGQDGKWHIGAKTGAAVGLGGAVGFELTVDPAKVTKTVSDAADAVGEIGDAVGDAAESAKDTISGWLD